MNIKKLIVFILSAFLPMVVIGLVMHIYKNVIVASLLSACAMFLPLVAVFVTRAIFK